MCCPCIIATIPLVTASSVQGFASKYPALCFCVVIFFGLFFFVDFYMLINCQKNQTLHNMYKRANVGKIRKTTIYYDTLFMIIWDLELKEDNKSCMVVISCVSQLLPERKPCWRLVRIWWFSTWSRMCMQTLCSNSLQVMQVRETGL